jgi:alkylation response protein AidB-like acyl-CoA dehydrogenase
VRPLSERTEHYRRVAAEIAPELERLADETEQHDEFPWEAFHLLNDHGLMKLTLPKEWGGEGMSATDYFPVYLDVAKVSGAIRMLIHGQNGIWRMIEGFGSDAQKNEWLPKQVAGAVFAGAITEPGGTGRGMTTTATRDGDEWVINGEKQLISFAGEAILTHVFAATGRDEAGAVLTCFLVPKDVPGQIMTRMPPSMGCRGSTHYHIRYDNVRVPHSSILGKQGDGLEIALRTMLDISRISIAYAGLAISQRAFELAVDFAKNRVTLGKPIASRQAIRLSIAEMATDLYALDSALHDACRRFDAGESIIAEAAATKLLGLETAGRVTDRALRIHGGVGYLESHKIERHYRDARALWFEEGTAEIQKFVIAEQVLQHGLTF